MVKCITLVWMGPNTYLPFVGKQIGASEGADQYNFYMCCYSILHCAPAIEQNTYSPWECEDNWMGRSSYGKAGSLSDTCKETAVLTQMQGVFISSWSITCLIKGSCVALKNHNSMLLCDRLKQSLYAISKILSVLAIYALKTFNYRLMLGLRILGWHWSSQKQKLRHVKCLVYVPQLVSLFFSNKK